MNSSTQYIPRVIHKLYAWWRGLAWRPCVICGDEFGGHEPISPSLLANSGKLYPVCGRRACWEFSRQQFRWFQIEEERKHHRLKVHRQCTGKVKYPSDDRARTVRDQSKNGLVLEIYRCPHCQYWHIGHQSTRQRRTLIDLKKAIEAKNA